MAKNKNVNKKPKKKAIDQIEHVNTKGLPARMIRANAEKLNEVIDRINERSK